MATLNPLEQKARSSFRKGLLIAGLLGILVALVLGYFIYTMKDAEKARIAAQKKVAILKQSVKSGEEITADMVSDGLANGEVVSADAMTVGEIVGQMTTDGSDGIERAVKLIAKIDIPAKAIVTPEMFTTEETVVTDDIREQEYNVILLPANLQTGDTIDVRLRLPSGDDYIVVSKKNVTIPESAGMYSTNLMSIEVNELEQLSISSAIVESYQITGAKLYASKYTEPGIQGSATVTYMPSETVINLINTDPNIVETARTALVAKLGSLAQQYRAPIQSQLNNTDEEDRQSQLETGIQTEISTQESDRKAYLEALGE